MPEKETFDIKKSIIAQSNLCKEKGYPYFAPFTGKCWKCKKNIYAEGGISVKSASIKLITSCPFCYRSYCD